MTVEIPGQGVPDGETLRRRWMELNFGSAAYLSFAADQEDYLTGLSPAERDQYNRILVDGRLSDPAMHAKIDDMLRRAGTVELGKRARSGCAEVTTEIPAEVDFTGSEAIKPKIAA